MDAKICNPFRIITGLSASHKNAISKLVKIYMFVIMHSLILFNIIYIHSTNSCNFKSLHNKAIMMFIVTGVDIFKTHVAYWFFNNAANLIPDWPYAIV